MGNEDLLKNALLEAFKSLNFSSTLQLTPQGIIIEHSKDPVHGDYSTNAALKYAKALSLSPLELANKLKEVIDCPIIEKIEIAGPGFINFFVKREDLSAILKVILEEGSSFGRHPNNGKKIDVEFVSANPTGDLHLGHTRIAAVGDCLCNILEWAGYEVTREFYVNDCGAQIEHLGISLRARYRELFGYPLELGEDDYHGEDIILIAQKLKEEYGDAYLQDNQATHDFFIQYGMKEELAKLWKGLEEFGVKFDKVTYESQIRSGDTLNKAIDELTKKGYVYSKDGATFLKTTAFLDDKDRPIVKSNGDPTYFLPDICYHYDKMNRGYDTLIDVFGADHHGYLARMKSALMMKGYLENVIDFVLVQVVRVFSSGEEIKMSKRTGKALKHRDLVQEVGADAVRYFLLERSPSSHLDFNYDLAKEQSASNPVYYAQYAFARCCSVLQLAADLPLDESGSFLNEEIEKSILKHLADFPSMILATAEEKAPQKLVAYVHRLAELVHSFYSECRIIDRDHIEITSSRLALVKAIQIVLSNALSIIGISAPRKM